MERGKGRRRGTGSSLAGGIERWASPYLARYRIVNLSKNSLRVRPFYGGLPYRRVRSSSRAACAIPAGLDRSSKRLTHCFHNVLDSTGPGIMPRSTRTSHHLLCKLLVLTHTLSLS